MNHRLLCSCVLLLAAGAVDATAANCATSLTTAWRECDSETLAAAYAGQVTREADGTCRVGGTAPFDGCDAESAVGNATAIAAAAKDIAVAQAEAAKDIAVDDAKIAVMAAFQGGLEEIAKMCYQILMEHELQLEYEIMHPSYLVCFERATSYYSKNPTTGNLDYLLECKEQNTLVTKSWGKQEVGLLDCIREKVQKEYRYDHQIQSWGWKGWSLYNYLSDTTR